jgi:hypothetical protein
MREYREFCQETRCVHYNFVRQMESIEEPTENDKRELGIALVQCQQNCQRTAHDFYEWLKEREIIKSPSS